MEERLRKFAGLVDAGSFTKAAAELHVSQPALSAAVAKLERELKARLIVRGVRPLSLTPAGKLAYQSAVSMSMQADNLRLRLAELADEAVSLRVGMIDSIADTLFAEGGDLAMLDKVRLSVVVNNSRYLTEAVERAELDFAFVASRPSSSPSLEARPVADEPLVVVGHPVRTLSAGGVLTDFISYDQASNTARLVRLALKSYGLTVQVGFYSTSPEVILRLTLQNKGVAALPYLMVREHLQSGRLAQLERPRLIIRPILSVKRRDRELPAVFAQMKQQIALSLSDLLQEISKD